ncbi:MAG: hypothetical protein KJ072_22325 [Verrucomicrobia bacterium]|nr:hypothetical protein [Verrucomicrobiota bacterium]
MFQGIFLHTRVGWRGRVSPDNARERVKNEKTRTISSFSIVLLRKSANASAETVQIFGHFLTGKNALREIAADLNLIRILQAGKPGDDPPVLGRYAQRERAGWHRRRMPVIRSPDPRSYILMCAIGP